MKGQGILYIISAPSGAGKTSLIRLALKHFNDLKPSISHTTRPPRSNEKDGVDYFFISDETFEKMKAANEFVEYADVHKYKYGTSKKFVKECTDNGIDLLFDVDVKGAINLRKIYPNAKLIFVLTPSFGVLRERLEKRMTNMISDIDVRMKNAAEEITSVGQYDYLIINDDLMKAYEELKAIVVSTKLAQKINEFKIEDYINN